MQVLLIQDVDNLGYAGDVKKVAPGYGRNYLLPQKMAIIASPGALKQAETIRKAAEKRRARELEDAKAIVNQIEGVQLSFERRAGELGKLYGSVTSRDIADALAEKTEIALDKRKIALPEPIRQLGEYHVPIKVVMDLSTQIKVEVLTEGALVERARQARKEAERAAAEAEARAKAEAEAAERAEAEGSQAVADNESPVDPMAMLEAAAAALDD